eukprot:3290485-Amphidinium_carterae.3
MCSSTLQVRGVTLLPLHVPENSEQLFRSLCEQVRLDQQFGRVLNVDLGCESLEDFKTLLTTPAEVETKVLNHCLGLDRPQFQAARLRQAWQAVVVAGPQASETLCRGRESSDPEALLPESQIIELRTLFHKHYHISQYPLHMERDYLKSKLVREIEKFILQVLPVWKARTLNQQMRQERKRHRVSENVQIVLEAEDA